MVATALDTSVLSERRLLLPLLVAAQHADGFVSAAVVDGVARGLGLTPNEVFGVASFYPYFRFEPPAGPAAGGSPEPVATEVVFAEHLAEPAAATGEVRYVVGVAGSAPTAGSERGSPESGSQATLEELAAVAAAAGAERVFLVEIGGGGHPRTATAAGVDIEIVPTLPAAVLSEDSVVVAALEGRRPMPSPPWTPARPLELFGALCVVIRAEPAAPAAPAATGTAACAVDLARQSMAFSESESCGRCVVCREGTMQMAEILRDICAGRGRAGDIDLLVLLAETLAATGPCGWGRAAAAPVLTTIRDFRADYDAHLMGEGCTAGVCSAGGAG